MSLASLYILDLCKERAERLGVINFFDHAACQRVILYFSGWLTGIS